jgi:hypothetical protein
VQGALPTVYTIHNFVINSERRQATQPDHFKANPLSASRAKQVPWAAMCSMYAILEILSKG